VKISFATTCKGRLHHLRETLPQNLRDTAHIPDLEFNVIDYNSPDGFEEWMRANMSAPIASGRVVYYREKTLPNFIIPHAKNLAHIVGTGDVLLNLDADEFLGEGFTEQFIKVMGSRKKVVAQFGIHPGHGGRIGFHREDFYKLRGYEEEKMPWGRALDDLDLWTRALHEGLQNAGFQWPTMRAIEHGPEERIKFSDVKDLGHIHHWSGEIVKSRKPGDVVNLGGWGRAVFYRNFSGEPIRVGEGPYVG
jgi:hypothetical protein